MRTQADHIKEFWQWFEENKVLFETLTDSSRNERLTRVLEHLRPISDDLSVEVSKEFHGVRDIVISAEGDISKFQIVKDIVTAAPKMSGWTITAFRQKAKEDFILHHKDLKFNSSKMFFHPIIEGDSLDLIIYVDSIKGKNSDDVIHYGLITMDNILGEYDSVTKVRHYDFYDLAEEKDRSQLKKMKYLPGFINQFYKTKKHGE